MQTTKDKILDAVISYIKQETNLNQVSISDIAKKAEIGKSTVYEHFENKDALIEETYVYLLEKYEKILFQEIIDKQYKKAMISQLSNILEVMEDVKGIMEVILNSHSELGFLGFDRCSKKIETIQLQIEKRFIEIFSIGVQSGDIVPFNKPYSSNVIKAIVSGLMFQYVDEKMEIERNELLELIFDEINRVIQS
jgi:AcrR family transcriptional regulator